MNPLSVTMLVTEFRSTEAEGMWKNLLPIGERWSLTTASTVFFIAALTLILLCVIVHLTVYALDIRDKMPPKLAQLLSLKKVVAKLKWEAVEKDGRNIEYILSGTVILFLVAVICGAYGVINLNDHLAQNVQQKYDVETIHFTKTEEHYSVQSDMFATVINGDQTYELIITQNPDTYEPTLLSPETNTEMMELRK